MGKGSTRRPTDQKTFDKNMEAIFGRREKDYGGSGHPDEVAKSSKKNDNRTD